MSIAAAIVGASGYVGGEIMRLLATHPEFKLVAAASASRAGEPIAKVFPHLAPAFADTGFVDPRAIVQALDRGSELALFSAAPHGASAGMVATILEAARHRAIKVRVVDSSADFRYASVGAFEKVYGVPHAASSLLDDFICAVPEHKSDTPAKHVGHPGCFATAILLAAMPLASLLAPPAAIEGAKTGELGGQPGTPRVIENPYPAGPPGSPLPGTWRGIQTGPGEAGSILAAARAAGTRESRSV